ncbi:MAG TPA: CRISPR-associated endonuclease Cas2 [Syntrophorhabdaceae bacterium]|nr:CRISPR-associated endonuclease Cas2 [Syntrophorhabdaceae bacterium]
MRKYIVVAYDITDDDRRNKVSDILSSYGQRVNKSVFECFLEVRDIYEIKKKIANLIKKSEDIVLYYYLCKDCLDKVERIGNFHQEKQIVKII